MYDTITNVQWKVFPGDGNEEKCYRFRQYLRNTIQAKEGCLFHSVDYHSPTRIATRFSAGIVKSSLNIRRSQQQLNVC